MSLKVEACKDERPRFQYCWEGFVANRIERPRKGDDVASDPRALARAAFEAGWEAAGGEPHKSRDECRHENVRGIAVVMRPCPSCGKPVY